MVSIDDAAMSIAGHIASAINDLAEEVTRFIVEEILPEISRSFTMERPADGIVIKQVFLQGKQLSGDAQALIQNIILKLTGGSTPREVSFEIIDSICSVVETGFMNNYGEDDGK